MKLTKKTWQSTKLLYYRTKLNFNSNDPHVCKQLGGILVGQDKLLEALNYYQKALKNHHPNIAETYLQLGELLFDLGDYQESVQACKKSIEIRPLARI